MVKTENKLWLYVDDTGGKTSYEIYFCQVVHDAKFLFNGPTLFEALSYAIKWADQRALVCKPDPDEYELFHRNNLKSLHLYLWEEEK